MKFPMLQRLLAAYDSHKITSNREELKKSQDIRKTTDNPMHIFNKSTRKSSKQVEVIKAVNGGSRGNRQQREKQKLRDRRTLDDFWGGIDKSVFDKKSPQSCPPTTSWWILLTALLLGTMKVPVVLGCCASDGTIAINGASTSSFNLASSSGTDATTQVYTMDPTILDGATITCTYTCVTAATDAIFISLKFGSLPSGTSDSDATTENTSSCSGTEAQRTVFYTQSLGLDATGYVFMRAVGGSSSNDVVLGVVITCTAPVTPAPTVTPGTPTASPSSVGPTTATPTPAPTCSCFSESDTVKVQPPSLAPNLAPPKPVAMKDLKVGQKVFAGWSHRQEEEEEEEEEEEDSGGIGLGGTNQQQPIVGEGKKKKKIPIYETVYGFGHRNEEKHIEYLRIILEDINGAGEEEQEQPLEISGSHLIFVHNQQDPIPAHSLRVGDPLVYHKSSSPLVEDRVGGDGDDSTVVAVVARRIAKIERVWRKGVYEPLTKDGTIVVNGIEASTYISIQELAPRLVQLSNKVFSDQRGAHLFTAPYRFVCTKVAPQLCVNDYNMEEEGINHWMAFGKNYIVWYGENLPTWLMAIYLVLVMSFFGVFLFLDNFLEGDIWSISLAVLGLALYYGLGWVSHKKKATTGKAKIE